jgi:hypothetical protein
MEQWIRAHKICIALSLASVFILVIFNYTARAAQTQGPLDELTVTALPAKLAKASLQTVTVTAKSGGAVKDDYTGTVTFTSIDTLATLPPDYTFVGSDHGVKTFTAQIAFNQVGTYDLTVEDTVAGFPATQSGIEIFLGHANGSLIKKASSAAANTLFSTCPAVRH